MQGNNGMLGWTVVVVEDDPDSLEIASLLLELRGLNVIKAEDGALGLEAVRRHLPDLVISDLSMPHFNGWQLIEQLKADVLTQHIPVIALTAHAMAGDREKVLAAGFNNYLSKPLSPDTFFDDIVKIVNSIPVSLDEQ